MRILGWTLLGLVLAVLVVVLVILVPPHRQIRGIEPAVPTLAEIRDAVRVPGGPESVEFFAVASQAMGERTLGHTVFLLRWADGGMFMIDAGMDEVAAAEFAELLASLGRGGEHVYAASIADALGSAIADVRGVGLTHLHIDHAQGLLGFCEKRGRGARVYQTRDQATEHNLHTRESAGIVRESCLEPGELAGDTVLSPAGFPGLAMVALGGHTPGSTLFAAEVAGHLWLFSGDITNTKSAIVDDHGKGFLYSWIMVPENTARTGLLRDWLREADSAHDVTVVVSHDLDDARATGMPERRRP